MSNKLILCTITQNGVPATGLTPLISIWEVSTSGTLVINAQSMFEVGDGGYGYNFGTYDETKDYFIKVDGGSELNDYDRYCFGVNDSTSISEMETHLATSENVTEINNNIINLSGSLSTDIDNLSGNLNTKIDLLSGELNFKSDIISGSMYAMVENFGGYGE